MFDWTSVFEPANLAYAVAGAVLGVVVGALPGLAANTALALLLGFTYSMPVEAAVIFLLAVWSASEFGGAITAILANIPGTPETVPTQLAGRPLALAGQGGLAVGASVTFSALGNWIGLLLLILIVPFLIELALQFSSWETFLLGMLGVALSGTMTAREQPLKGWIMGTLGLLLATVGKEAIHGIDRFTFGVPQLISGIGYMPVLIGVFGIAEVVNVLTQPSIKTVLPDQVGRIFPPLSMIREYWKSTLRSGGIGMLIGAIPGAGAQVASYMAYTAGERATGRRFSDGDMEGVVCSEVANNAVIGGGLLPTVTLGIPGTSSCALIMAALTLHGVVLGPNIQNDEPGFLTFLYVALLVGNFCMYVCAFAMIKPSLYVLSMPAGAVMSSVIIVSLIGTFAIGYSMFDVFVMYAAGIIGFWLNRQGYPFAPLVLGLILGQIVDDSLRRTLLIYEGQFEDLLFRPLGLLLLSGVVFAFVWGIKRSRDEARRLQSLGLTN
jgi:putative tricarboxylic transport membrane protein